MIYYIERYFRTYKDHFITIKSKKSFFRLIVVIICKYIIEIKIVIILN